MAETQRIEIVFGDTPLKIMEVSEPPPVHTLLTVKFNQQFIITVKGDHVMYTLPVDHAVRMQVAYVDSKGNPASIDGEVSWESSDSSMALVEPDPQDSTSCRVVPVGSIGQVQITASVDADLGEGLRELITTADIEIVGGEAVSGSIQPVGEPQPLAPTATQHS